MLQYIVQSSYKLQQIGNPISPIQRPRTWKRQPPRVHFQPHWKVQNVMHLRRGQIEVRWPRSKEQDPNGSLMLKQGQHVKFCTHFKSLDSSISLSDSLSPFKSCSIWKYHIPHYPSRLVVLLAIPAIVGPPFYRSVSCTQFCLHNPVIPLSCSSRLKFQLEFIIWNPSNNSSWVSSSMHWVMYSPLLQVSRVVAHLLAGRFVWAWAFIFQPIEEVIFKTDFSESTDFIIHTLVGPRWNDPPACWAIADHAWLWLKRIQGMP